MSDQYLDQSTIGELAGAALRLIGAVASGETPTADEIADAVKDANRMVAGWGNRRGLTLSPVAVLVTVTNATSYPVTGLMRVDNAYDNVTGQPFDLGDTSAFLPGPLNPPNYFGPGLVVTAALSPPGLTLNLYGGPSFWTAGRQIALFGPPRLPQWKTPGDSVSLPDGWDEAITYNLAKRLAPQYGLSAPPEVIDVARSSLANISALNAPRIAANVDPMFAMQNGGGCGSGAVNGYRGDC